MTIIRFTLGHAKQAVAARGYNEYKILAPAFHDVWCVVTDTKSHWSGILKRSRVTQGTPRLEGSIMLMTSKVCCYPWVSSVAPVNLSSFQFLSLLFSSSLYSEDAASNCGVTAYLKSLNSNLEAIHRRDSSLSAGGIIKTYKTKTLALVCSSINKDLGRRRIVELRSQPWRVSPWN